MRALQAAWLAIALAACSPPAPERAAADATAAAVGTPVPMRHARTFRVVERDGYRIVDLKASIVNWGGGAKGPEQHARIVLVPRGMPAPALTGDLAGATRVEVPLQRIAVNYAPFEAMAVALGVQDRLVAVGGVKSWDDGIRARARAGKLAQIGYGWHSPPELDALVAARPDALLMSMGDLGHAQHMDRIRSLGIAVVPAFLEAEPDYMGKVDYVRLFGMLVGKEAEADAYVADVQARVDALKAVAAAQPQKTAISAWFAGGDRWMATIRNADAQLLRDANGRNPLQVPDDPRQDAFQRISTERLLRRGRDADCWILRDTHSRPFTNVGTLRLFKAYRDGCLFASDGMRKPEADAYDFYETAVIRPDLILEDLVGMLHPSLRDGEFLYIRPDTQVAK